MLDISKVSVYKKLNKQLKNELTNHIKLADRVKYITDEGLKIIKDSIDINLVNNQVNENKKLMEYIAVTREDDNKKGFFSRLFILISVFIRSKDS